MATVKFGLENSITRPDFVGRSVGDIASDPAVIAALDLPREVTPVLNGSPVSTETMVEYDDVLSFERRAATKA
jgi:hypothetical protein